MIYLVYSAIQRWRWGGGVAVAFLYFGVATCVYSETTFCVAVDITSVVLRKIGVNQSEISLHDGRMRFKHLSLSESTLKGSRDLCHS
jgi:general stress protein CsbA